MHLFHKMVKPKTLNAQAWIGTPIVDTVFILLPPFLSLFFIVLFPSLFQDNDTMPDLWWVMLVLLVDVAHVYSTLYRTYFDKQVRTFQKPLLIAIPFIAFTTGVLVYSVSPMLFWRLLAYLAVFHFVRQQYGFMRLYSRKENAANWMNVTDKITIYYATIYPLLYWHLSAPRNFNWFVPGDFIYASSDILLGIAKVLYYLVLAMYVVKEIIFIVQTKEFNVPKIAVIFGTALSWYFGIVYYNGDLAFTLLNVVSHGIPYMALVWIYTNKSAAKNKPEERLKTNKWKYNIFAFLGIIFLFAYIEEGLWDAFLWKERHGIFESFSFESGTLLLNIIVPLLAMPQITHYIIDGYIWKIRKKNTPL